MPAVNTIRIDDPQDPRVSAYRDIRDRDLVGRQRRFVAEGSVVLRHLLVAGRFELESVLVLENRLAGLAETLAGLKADVPIYCVGRQVLDAIAGFPMHRGVLAIGLKGEEISPGALLDQLGDKATIVVCHGIANHDNMGAIFRNAAAFGVAAVLLDSTCCDPLYRKAIRVSVGAALSVPTARFDVDFDLPAVLAARRVLQLALTPLGSIEIAKVRRAPRTAIYLGAEGPGLSPELIKRLVAVRINLAAGFDSLNVATAQAIALHHLST